MLISRAFTFDAAHQLPKYDGICRNLHGHTYRLVVTIDHPVQADGIAFDFHQLKRIVEKQVLRPLDHTFLNDRFEDPTAEVVALWIWRELLRALPVRLHEIQLHETPNSYVTYRGEQG